MLILLFGGTRKLQGGMYKGFSHTYDQKFFLSSFCRKIAYFKGGLQATSKIFDFSPPPPTIKQLIN